MTTTLPPNVSRADAASFLDPREQTSSKEPPQAKEARMSDTTTPLALLCRTPDGVEHVWQEIEETTLRLIRQPTDVFTRCRRADLFSEVVTCTPPL